MPKNKKTLRGSLFLARPPGIEPGSRASETLILSIELRAQKSYFTLYLTFCLVHFYF